MESTLFLMADSKSDNTDDGLLPLIGRSAATAMNEWFDMNSRKKES